MKLLDGIVDSMDMSLSKLKEIVKDREAWHDAAQRVIHDLATEKQVCKHQSKSPCSSQLPAPPRVHMSILYIFIYSYHVTSNPTTGHICCENHNSKRNLHPSVH